MIERKIFFEVKLDIILLKEIIKVFLLKNYLYFEESWDDLIHSIEFHMTIRFSFYIAFGSKKWWALYSGIRAEKLAHVHLEYSMQNYTDR